jgi:hypothetical protein
VSDNVWADYMKRHVALTPAQMHDELANLRAALARSEEERGRLRAVLRDMVSVWRGRSEYRARSATIEDRAISETWNTAAHEAECCLDTPTAPEGSETKA